MVSKVPVCGWLNLLLVETVLRQNTMAQGRGQRTRFYVMTGCRKREKGLRSQVLLKVTSQ